MAGVIENRLKKKMPLQIDATIQYLLDKPKELLLEDLKVESPYNTYLNPGLPPGPDRVAKLEINRSGAVSGRNGILLLRDKERRLEHASVRHNVEASIKEISNISNRKRPNNNRLACRAAPRCWTVAKAEVTTMPGKPELLIAAGSSRQAERYIHAGADAVLIGEPRFGMRLPGAIEADEAFDLPSRKSIDGRQGVCERQQAVPQRGDRRYCRLICAPWQLPSADAIVFGDPAVLLMPGKPRPDVPLHWNAEMTGTNSAAANYWGRRGAVRAVLARELNEEEIAAFRRGTKCKYKCKCTA